MFEVFLQEHSQDIALVLRNWLSGTLAGCWTSCSVETWKMCSCRNTSSICTRRNIGQNVKREKCSCRNIVENFRRCVAFCNTSKVTSHFQYFVSNTWCIISVFCVMLSHFLLSLFRLIRNRWSHLSPRLPVDVIGTRGLGWVRTSLGKAEGF